LKCYNFFYNTDKIYGRNSNVVEILFNQPKPISSQQLHKFVEKISEEELNYILLKYGEGYKNNPIWYQCKGNHTMVGDALTNLLTKELGNSVNKEVIAKFVQEELKIPQKSNVVQM
jgi:hypothetical protein